MENIRCSLSHKPIRLHAPRLRSPPALTPESPLVRTLDSLAVDFTRPKGCNPHDPIKPKCGLPYILIFRRRGSYYIYHKCELAFMFV